MRRLFPVTYETADHAGGEGRAGSAGPGRADARERDLPGHAEARERGFPGRAEAREWDLDALADAYAYPERAAGEVWLRANMVSTLDGAAQHDGRSQPISCPADMRIFGTLRGLADAVVVGAQTVRQEGYRPARARDAFLTRRKAAGQGPAPAIAVISASLDLDFGLPLFTEPLVPTYVITGAAAPADRVAAARAAGAEVLVAGDGAGAEPERAVRALAERGLTRLLTEGGPRLLGQFVAARVLDELCLTVSPMLTAGGAQRIAGGPELALPERFELASLLEEDGFLFSRYRRNRHSAE